MFTGFFCFIPGWFALSGEVLSASPFHFPVLQQGKPPLMKCFTTRVSQKQPPDAGSCGNSSRCSKPKLLSRPSFCELALHMKDEGAALYYVFQVSLAFWKLFNPTIN